MKRYRELYQAKQLPVFQNRMFHSEQDARQCARGDVVLVQDLETGLIFNEAFRPELMQYDADYQNEQGESAVFQRHLEKMSDVVLKHFHGESLLEVGCGKGRFLEQLQGTGFDITGLDPTYEGSNPSVIKQYFSREVGLRADGVILRHVLEHVQDPVAFISGIRDANGGSGKIFIEVPCFDWICRHRCWMDIFYEHVNYFRLSDFYGMFGSVHEAGHAFGGQYLYVVADLSTIRVPAFDAADRVEFPQDFLDTVDQYVVRLRERSRAEATPSAIWGGASKGVIFALFMERRGANIELVVDINPAKQGLYLAATGLRVRSPADVMSKLSPGADLFVMNSNYLPEIQSLTKHRFNYLSVEHEAS
jgi:SAM-dependent methyltransferase